MKNGKWLRAFAALLLYCSFALLSAPSAPAATGCTYPTTLDTFADVTQDQDLTAAMYNKLQCAIEKAEAELGTLPKGSYATVKARLDDAVYLVGNQTVAGVKTFSDVLTSALGAITADKQNLSATATWNAAGVAFTAIKLNITNTASDAGSTLIALQVDSVNKFRVNRSGIISNGEWQATSIATTFTDAKLKTLTGTASRVTIAGTATDPTVDIHTSYVGQSSITTLGTIGTGTWQGTSIATTFTDAKLKTLTGTASRVTIGGTATDPTVDIHASYVGQSSITTLGTIGAGVWQGTAIAAAYGGMGFTSYTSGDMFYASGATAISKLAANATATKKFLTMTSSVPAYSLIDSFALFDTGLCTDGQIAKKVTGAWACATDATAGSPSLDTVADPAASKTFLMTSALLGLTWGSSTPVSSSLFTVIDGASNTGTGYLFDVHTSTGSALKPLRVTVAGTANGVEMSTAGALAAIGTGTITANRTSCSGTQYLRFDGTCASTAVGVWSDLGSPTGNLALTMGAFTSTFTYNDVTSTVNLAKWIDTASNTGTGYLATFETASGSTLKPLRVSYRGADSLTVVAGNVGVGTASANATQEILKSQSGFSSTSHLLLYNSNETNADYVGVLYGTRSISGNRGKGWLGMVRTGDNGVGDFVWLLDAALDDAGIATTDEVMRLTSAGRLGLGVAAPATRMEIRNPVATNLIATASTALYISRAASTNVMGITFDAAVNARAIIGVPASTDDLTVGFSDGTTYTERVRFQRTTGNVGIGTTSPNEGLEMGATLNVRIPNIKSTTGTRYVCVNTDGTLVSSASVCSGT